MMMFKIGYSTVSGNEGTQMVRAENYQQALENFRNEWNSYGDYNAEVSSTWDCHESWSIES